ncbi:hypothetical protein KSP40_PGU003481 [Platanthera guangdongensis]|uniref:Uncharacterized protein n=1 Tax=Platanthera guangdongensis TaxID=2320717 RepID=A0ABR2LDL8_9ASPA
MNSEEDFPENASSSDNSVFIIHFEDEEDLFDDVGIENLTTNQERINEDQYQSDSLQSFSSDEEAASSITGKRLEKRMVNSQKVYLRMKVLPRGARIRPQTKIPSFTGQELDGRGSRCFRLFVLPAGIEPPELEQKESPHTGDGQNHQQGSRLVVTYFGM